MSVPFWGKTTQAPGSDVAVSYPIDLSSLSSTATVSSVVGKDVTNDKQPSLVTGTIISGSGSGSGSSYVSPQVTALKLHHTYHIIFLCSVGSDTPSGYIEIECVPSATTV